MSAIKDGGPAYPVAQEVNPTSQDVTWYAEHGMTLRDYFAAKTMQSILPATLGGAKPDDAKSVCITVAKFSYIMADAMLKERET